MRSSHTVVYTQDQLDKRAREQGLVRVVPLWMRDEPYRRSEAMPDRWFYTDKIKEMCDTYDTAYESGDQRKRMLRDS